ncbi:hypothetical protein [Streptomyces noursei]|uniref:hypothetical protein n=1 Tax=Streptomyces noursei TaxID=1971 RepID=UPI0016727B77|nr:hypothetical protein [Streptomyces noursei]MCZ1021452.1 hypothetical protein [Streptomyces noursei]GGX46558.1 hypothetical protein GCM10010341_80410 [Streptomyces noursei]
MTTALAEMTELHLEVTEFDRIECAECGKISPFLDDGDDGTNDAHQSGDWHVLNLDECGCSNLCTPCAEDQCGRTVDTPRLFGMRVI